MHRFGRTRSKSRLPLKGTVSPVEHEAWTHRDSNPGHPPCKGGTLPLSYGPTSTHNRVDREIVLALVVQRCPIGHSVVDRTCGIPLGGPGATAWSRSVEVIQPQIPLRLPCYDLSPLAEPRFDLGIEASSGPHSGALTGGVCKEQGRIHRALLRRDYYRIQLHEDEFQSSIRTTTEFRRLASPFGVASHCLGHCSPRVAQHIRGILTYRCPFLPPVWHWQSS